jgi:spermidine synthase
MSQIQKILYEGKHFYIQREGTQIVAITRASATEYSRLDIKTKKAIHWYARKMCERIYHRFRNKEAPLEIVCLGSAAGAIPYELLSHYSKAHLTCVDIDYESLYVIQNSILKEFEPRVSFYEGDARQFLSTVNADTIDIVLNDLFTEQDSPPFIHTQTFLRSIFRCLKTQGLYLANTISDTIEYTHGSSIEKIGYDVERFSKKQEGVTNIVYEAVKD